ncbi:hypothetical protein N9878_00305 [bacterium]|nr:hypothetical protein [bacterium]
MSVEQDVSLGRNFGGQWIGNLRAEPGGIYVDDTLPQTGEWFSLVVIEDMQLSAITQPMFTNTAALVGKIFLAGTVLYGYTTEFTLAFGTVQAVRF